MIEGVTAMIFEKDSTGKVIISQDLLLELKEKAQKYDDLLQEQRDKERLEKKEQGGNNYVDSRL